jgi:Na+(H+)/acetate symporter ActP
MGDPQEMGYKFWTDAQEEEQSAARIMSGMIWLTWLINQYVILIFSFNFLVSVISQSYEEALNKSLVVRYTFRCERVMEASIMTKVF